MQIQKNYKKPAAPYDQVIVALDYEKPEKAFRLVDEIEDLITWFKVGSVLFTRSGAEILSYLHKKNKKIFLDLKLHDTPSVVSETIKQIADLGVELTTVHCLGGRQMLRAASLSCRSSQLRLLGLTLLTSQEASESRALGWIEEGGTTGVVLRLLDLALEARLAGILCSPHEISQVRNRALPGLLTVTPGIRIPGEEVFQDDQKRVASPTQAIESGADFIIVGRPITLAREPRAAVERLFTAPATAG
jgi:orotidine-5'-phosphate decarboxylase